jgi:DNA repair protein RadD
MIELRPYQLDVIERCRREVAAGRRRILLVSPTGSGKTLIASAIVAGAAAKGKQAIFLAHRKELITQAANKLWDAGIDAGSIRPGAPSRPAQAVQVASIPTLHGRALRSRSIELPDADVVVVDEAHHARASTYTDIFAAYPGAVVLGLTATPCRGDGRGLGNVFDVIVECPSVAELIKLGFLVPSVIYAPATPDLSGVQVRRGDYVEAQLAERMDQPQLVGDIVDHWLRLGQRRPTVIFATGVAHSVHLADEFCRAGVRAAHLDGCTPADERDAILARLDSGELELITNCAVLCEGWDQPKVSCLVLARPTKSLGLFRQMVGRVLRPAEDKTNALILDHSGAVFQHGLPEDDIAWTLHADRRALNPTHAARGKHRARSLVDCPQCGAVRLQGQPCTGCGWRAKPGAEAIEVAEGELGRVDTDRVARKKISTDSEKRRFYAELLAIVAERNGNPGRAKHLYREKFGDWPQYQVGPIEPRPETRSWFKSRQIAFAKRMAKQRNAA